METARNLDTFTAKYTEADVLRVVDQMIRRPTKELLADEGYTNKQRLLSVKATRKARMLDGT